MTQEEMWKAVTENDTSYDGLFFYGVKTTGIYCRPSCKSKIPNQENVLFFNTIEDATSKGFRSCKRCRSDLLDYKPIKEIAVETKKLLDTMFLAKADLNNELNNLGVTKHRMTEIFKDEYGVTLTEYINKLRLNEAKRLLTETDNDVVDIAYYVGFESLSAFYRFFKEAAGTSPAAYRREKKVDG